MPIKIKSAESKKLTSWEANQLAKQSRENKPKYIAGEGPADARLMFVGEAGGKEEELEGRPFVGPSGKLLNQICYEVGIDRTEVYITNVVKYRPPNNNFRLLHTLGIDYEKCVEELWNEIREIQPNCILALGAEALKALTGLSKIKIYRGSLLKGKDGKTKVIGTYHPAAFLHQHDNTDGQKTGSLDYSMRTVVNLDFEKALEESRTSAWNLPERRLEIARTSQDVIRFFERDYPLEIADYRKPAADIETILGVPSCISFAFRPEHAMSIPLLPNLTPTINMPTHELAYIWKMVDYRLRNSEVIGQNWKFDDSKLSAVGFKTTLYADTAWMSKVLYPEFPVAQEFLTSIHTKEPYYKSEYREYDKDRDTYDRVLSYNAKDSAVDYEIWQALDKELRDEGLYEYYYDFWRHVIPMYHEIQATGLRVNFTKRAELRNKYINQYNSIKDKIENLVESKVNINSPKQVGRLMYEFLELPPRWHRNKNGQRVLSTDEDTIISLINAIDAKKHEWKKSVLRLILDGRKSRKTISTYLQARTDLDGRMRCGWRIIGTETGRSSTSALSAPDRLVQVGFPFQTATKHGEIGTDLRYMFLPDRSTIINEKEEGPCCFFQMDESQAEARVVAVLAKQWGLLEKFEAGIDVHSELASTINGKVWDGKRVDDNERFLGKTGRHSGNYDVQEKRFMLTVNTDAKKFGLDIEISLWRAKEILRLFHMANPEVREVYHADIKECLDRDRTLHVGNGAKRTFYGRLNEDLYREGFAYIPQNYVRYKLLKIMLAVKKEYPWVKFAIEAHDAFLICNMVERYVEEVGLFCREQSKIPLDFTTCSLPRDYKLVIPVDVEIGDNYKELKKVRITN